MPFFRFVLVCSCLVFTFSTAVFAEEKIDFSSQVRPILSDKCFHCHGPDADNQDSEFRADTKENLFADLGGYAAIVPGDLTASRLHERIHSKDEFEMMPPPDSNRSLSAEQKRILDLWIKQGAPYEGHWAFEKAERPKVPRDSFAAASAAKQWSPERVAEWTKNPIDVFLGNRLVQEKLGASPPADKLTLLRRASLTLTGLQPTPEQIRQFQNDKTEQAYENAVERILNSMSYAERQSLRWLDAARYADTDGFQNDSERTNWPWRDWVTKAYFDNMPFDQFTIEQLAGDMLPNATEQQQLASAFNRNHRQNAEGGALAAEFFVENVIDRVETTSTVFLGLTFGCARCHDHKYDPLSQREFYQMYAYFNNIGENGTGKGVSANPTMEFASPLMVHSEDLLANVSRAEQAVAEAKASATERMTAWVKEQAAKSDGKASTPSWKIAAIKEAKLTGKGQLKRLPANVVQFSAGGVTNNSYDLSLAEFAGTISALKLEAMPDASFTKPVQLAPSVNGNFVLTDVKLTVAGKVVTFKSATATYAQDKFPAANTIDANPGSGWAVHRSLPKPETVSLTLVLSEPVTLTKSDAVSLKLHFGSPYVNHAIGKLRVLHTDSTDDLSLLPTVNHELQTAISKPANKRTPAEAKALEDFYYSIDKPLLKAERALKAAKAEVANAGGKKARVMVMRERNGEPTPAYLLERGQYDQPDRTQQLTRQIPTALLSEGATQPKDRLELARWMVSRENPLTARVIVNRIWQDHFSIGLVKTAEDFGSQGEPPTHPELLDWLAVEFMESGWDVKALHRLIVTSAAYRQSSQVSQELHDRDPENRLLARGPRYRADGFALRDIALRAGGLLSETVGGPPVKPYQPEGLWAVVASNGGTRYKPDRGEALYRRSMYTYWKRAVNPPRQIIFDAGGREICNVRVRVTNTPLQALALMNDPTFIEAARGLAQRGLHLDPPQGDGKLSDQDRLAQMYSFAVAREASPKTLTHLQGSLDFFRRHFAGNEEAAKKFLAVGESPRDEQLPVIEHAAMAAVAHLILNLDETISVE